MSIWLVSSTRTKRTRADVGLHGTLLLTFGRNIAETFKTPGKLRGKTPRTGRKPNASEARVVSIPSTPRSNEANFPQPLADVFSATPNGSTNRFAQQLQRIQSPKSQTNLARSSPSPIKSVPRKQNIIPTKPAVPGGPSLPDSGYGSQDVYPQIVPIEDDEFFASQRTPADRTSYRATATSPSKQPANKPTVDLSTVASQSAKEGRTTRVSEDAVPKPASPRRVEAAAEVADARDIGDATVPRSRQSSSPIQPGDEGRILPNTDDYDQISPIRAADGSDEVRSTSDTSSPIRPTVVRKSSLNFASLPAREPLTGGKSLGGRSSRISHLDHNRKSYYNRHTGGKSLGNLGRGDASEDEDEIDMDSSPVAQKADDKVNIALNHNKTYTQRLQDQINMLGKSKPSGGRPSKSIPNMAGLQHTSDSTQLSAVPKSPTPKPFEAPQTTPGAFPEDDDDWIDPPPTQAPEPTQSPRPTLAKSHTADVMEGIEIRDAKLDSPQRAPLQGPLSAGFGHVKSASVPAVPANVQGIESQTHPLAKAVSVSNDSLAAISEQAQPQTPSKSPSRGFRDSPLKQVKNKLSSILKSSRGLLASSAALSAEGKTSILSPSASRLALNLAPSSDSLASKSNLDVEKQRAERDDDKTVPIARRTRASAERAKEEKRLEKETKRQEEQLGKLEKAREKEREKARVFSKEQERIAAMERQVTAKKDDVKFPVKETPKPTRTSPRKVQRPPESTTNLVDHDVDMTDAPPAVPSSAPRSAGPSQTARNKEIKRPIKPTRTIQTKTKQAPTVIKVNMGSQHSQYHSAASSSMANAPEPSAAPTPQPQQSVGSKASKATLQTKSSIQSLKGASSAGRPKATETALKKKEQEEREAQRRRDAKAEMERKRAVAQEEQRRQEQRRQEAEHQKQREREQAAAHAEAKNAQRLAMIEKAKQTRAPPPAVRAQPNGPPDYGHQPQDRAAAQPARPPSRMEPGIARSHDELSRPMLPNASKSGIKRALRPEPSDDTQGKRPPSRGGPSYQSTMDAKRRRTSDGYDDLDSDNNPPNIKGAPVRPSAGFKKVRLFVRNTVMVANVWEEPAKKSLFQGGYSNAPPGVSRDLFKATLTAQHNNQGKTTNPLDMAQISKGAIPFAPNSNPPGPSHKTPARPPTSSAAKSTAKAHKSSPRFQNGESIELPEIQTDDEDESEDEASRGMVAAWADSPDLRKALIRQETIDPSQIFGPPAPLNMEEVFSKSKDRWHKFRARTSSANWSGTDRLTEEEIRKDLAARDRLRRDGGWSYELSKEVS